MSEVITDYDSPWKEALERYFPAFMAFGFPEAYAGIDWTRGYEFLDKELQQVVRDAELGRRLADKLVKVWRLDGDETWVLIHLEVQGQVEADFAKRMFVYHYRLFDRYDRPVVSLAVLGDTQPRWRPSAYQQTLWGCRVQLTFPVLKLLDYTGQQVWLEQHPNPFAVVILAHLQAQATRNDPQARYAWKWRLIRGLYERGYERQDVLELFRFIDWLLQLPAELEARLSQSIQAYEEEQKMTYITSVERIGMQKGIEQGMQQGMEQGMQQGMEQGMQRGVQQSIMTILHTRFGESAFVLRAAVEALHDLEQLQALLSRALTAATLHDVEAVLPANFIQANA